MKAKKKPNQIKSTNVIKLLNVKTLQQPEKNTASTKQKTFATIQQNLRTFEYAEFSAKRQSLRGRLSFNKKSTVQRMQENNLSPFSNDGQSFSPKHMKTPQKLQQKIKQEKQTKLIVNIKEIDKKKAPKSKVNSARQTGNKKIKQNKTVANNLVHELKKKTSIKKKVLKLDKNQKQQKARIQFQNQFLNMMNNRVNNRTHRQKITEISDEELEASVRRKPKLHISLHDENHSRQDKMLRKKQQILRTMKIKVMENIQRDYPNLDNNQKKVICAVTIIQRLWRQRKVKQFFQHYITPKASPQTSMRQSFQKQISSNRSTMNLINHHLAKKSQEFANFQKAPTKIKNQHNFGQKDFLIRQKSYQSYQISDNQKNSQSSVKQQVKLNEKVNQLLQETIMFENQNEKIIKQSSNLQRPAMMKFLQCSREVKLDTKKKPSSRSKGNIFSLKQSLSEKCLMQKYYTKIFSDKPSLNQPKNYELFSANINKITSSTLKQNQQSSIELFKQINENADYIAMSPNKNKNAQISQIIQHKQYQINQSQQDQQVWIRNDTRYSQEVDSDQLLKRDENAVKTDKFIAVTNFDKQEEYTHSEKLIVDVQNDKIEDSGDCGIVINRKTSQSSRQKTQPSLKSIQQISEAVISELMTQFFSEYIGFRQKQCLVKKRKSKPQEIPKKPSLPGIQITPESITQYLNILIPYMFTHDRQEILKSLQLFHPSKYQKCHRVQSVIYEIFCINQDEQEQDIYWNIISNQSFFNCLEQYWVQNVKLTKQMQKFTNFLDLTYKVYNRCVTDAFSQIFNRIVLDMIVYPWDGTKKQSITQKIFQFKDQMYGSTLQKPSGTKIDIAKIKSIQSIVQNVKTTLLHQSFCYSTTKGKLLNSSHRNQSNSSSDEFQFGQNQHEILLRDKLSQQEFGKILKIANDEFLQDEKELIICGDQRYQLTADLSQFIFSILIQEVQAELQNFIGNVKLPQTQIGNINKLILEGASENATFVVAMTEDAKDNDEVFLETNQTMETNCQY